LLAQAGEHWPLTQNWADWAQSEADAQGLPILPVVQVLDRPLQKGDSGQHTAEVVQAVPSGPHAVEQRLLMQYCADGQQVLAAVQRAPSTRHTIEQ